MLRRQRPTTIDSVTTRCHYTERHSVERRNADCRGAIAHPHIFLHLSIVRVGILRSEL
jgi:hypothetical protein